MTTPAKALKPTAIGRVVSVTTTNGDEHVGVLTAFHRRQHSEDFLVYLQGVPQPVPVPAEGSAVVHQRVL